jgi:hypothetical protein
VPVVVVVVVVLHGPDARSQAEDNQFFAVVRRPTEKFQQERARRCGDHGPACVRGEEVGGVARLGSARAHPHHEFAGAAIRNSPAPRAGGRKWKRSTSGAGADGKVSHGGRAQFTRNVRMEAWNEKDAFFLVPCIG